jgi:hypothetical protein
MRGFVFYWPHPLAILCRWLVKRHGKVAVSKTCARCGTVRVVKHRTKKEPK